VLIFKNEFTTNGAVYSFVTQAMQSPYYKYLSLSKRHSMFHYYNDPAKKPAVDADGVTQPVVLIQNEL